MSVADPMLPDTISPIFKRLRLEKRTSLAKHISRLRETNRNTPLALNIVKVFAKADDFKTMYSVMIESTLYELSFTKHADRNTIVLARNGKIMFTKHLPLCTNKLRLEKIVSSLIDFYINRRGTSINKVDLQCIYTSAFWNDTRIPLLELFNSKSLKIKLLLIGVTSDSIDEISFNHINKMKASTIIGYNIATSASRFSLDFPLAMDSIYLKFLEGNKYILHCARLLTREHNIGSFYTVAVYENENTLTESIREIATHFETTKSSAQLKWFKKLQHPSILHLLLPATNNPIPVFEFRGDGEGGVDVKVLTVNEPKDNMPRIRVPAWPFQSFFAVCIVILLFLLMSYSQFSVLSDFFTNINQTSEFNPTFQLNDIIDIE